MRRLILLLACGAVGTAQAQMAESPAPTILSRGLGTAMQGGGSLARLRPYLSLNGVYDTGLTTVAVDGNGKMPEADGYGGVAEFGVTGYKNWRRTLLGLDYRGNVRHYSRNSYLDGSDHSLSLGVTYRLSGQLALTLLQTQGKSGHDQGVGRQQLISATWPTLVWPKIRFIRTAKATQYTCRHSKVLPASQTLAPVVHSDGSTCGLKDPQ